jgi:NTE family protein
LSLARSQNKGEGTDVRPRIGLALSGGAARGLSHIGVLKVLEELDIPIELIGGTSMGSVVGGLYAVGHTAAMLEEIAVTEDWVRLLTDPVDRRDLPVEDKTAEARFLVTLPVSRAGFPFPRGVVPGQRIWQMLTRLTWAAHAIQDFRQLPIPYVTLATDAETGGAVVLDGGFLPDAIRASMAMPTIFAPVEIDGRLLLDGGLARNLPAQDVRVLGADILICSDVTEPLKPQDGLITFFDILSQSASFHILESAAEQRALCDVTIDPDVKSFSTFGFDRASELIARGEAAARKMSDELEGLSRGTPSVPERSATTQQDSALIVRVEFEDLERTPEALVARVLGVEPTTWVSQRDLDNAIDRLYATRLLASVRYRLTPSSSGDSLARTLTVLAREGPARRFGFGFRYDSRYKVSVLVGGEIAEIAGNGSLLRLALRLGQQARLRAGISRGLGQSRSVRLGTRVEYVRSPFDLHDGSQRIAEARVDLGAISGWVGKSLLNDLQVTARGKIEYARWDDQVAGADVKPIERTFYAVAGAVDADTYDRTVFPSSGLRFRGQAEWGNQVSADGSFFSQYSVDTKVYIPVYPRISVWGGATVGATSGDAPPPHYQFFLGGANEYYVFPDRNYSFVGLDTQERQGKYVQRFELGAQWEFVDHFFGRFRWNAGNVFDEWMFDPGSYIDGFGVEVGASAFGGRLSIAVAGTGFRRLSGVEIDVGYPF